MKTETIGTLLIVGLIMFSTVVVFATLAIADEEPVLEEDPEGAPDDDPIRFKGTILKSDGTPDTDRWVIIQKWCHLGFWWNACEGQTNNDGYYETNYAWTWRAGKYRMKVDGTPVAEQELTNDDFEFDYSTQCFCITINY